LDFFVWVKGLQPYFSFTYIMSFVDLENNEYIVFNAWTSSALKLKYSCTLYYTPPHTQQEKDWGSSRLPIYPPTNHSSPRNFPSESPAKLTSTKHKIHHHNGIL
jgi:hypothetical protein